MTESTQQMETEVVFYAKLENEESLKKAKAMISHEQWEIKTPKGGKIRVRKTSKPNLEPTYEMTLKEKKPKKEDKITGSLETTIDISKELFEQFKRISDRGMLKDRYEFPISKVKIKDQSGVKEIVVEDRIFELDAFLKPNLQQNEKKYYDYIKIDLELDPILEQIKKNHPDIKEFKLNVNTFNLPIDRNSILTSTDESEVVKKKIDEIYETMFIRKE